MSLGTRTRLFFALLVSVGSLGATAQANLNIIVEAQVSDWTCDSKGFLTLSKFRVEGDLPEKLIPVRLTSSLSYGSPTACWRKALELGDRFLDQKLEIPATSQVTREVEWVDRGTKGHYIYIYESQLSLNIAGIPFGGQRFCSSRSFSDVCKK